MDIDEPVDNCIPTYLTDLRNNMLDHLSLNNEAHFKSQQINDPDLTSVEKRQIAESILDKNLGNFLSRFGKYLLEDHLKYFSQIAPNDYEVNFYLQDIKSQLSKTNLKSTVRNRRLEALRRLTSEGEYFSDEEMRKRNPVMFEHFVGRYLTDKEKHQVQCNNSDDQSFLGLLFNAIEEREIEERLKVEAVDEEEEEEEEYDESDSDDDVDKVQKAQFWGEHTSNEKPSSTKGVKKKNRAFISDNEKVLLMDEFRSQVYSEFLGGKDSDFDYSKVDSNRDYDDLKMLENDDQDDYFDSETPEIMSKGDASSDSSISFDPPRSLTQKMEDLGK